MRRCQVGDLWILGALPIVGHLAARPERRSTAAPPPPWTQFSARVTWTDPEPNDRRRRDTGSVAGALEAADGGPRVRLSAIGSACRCCRSRSCCSLAAFLSRLSVRSVSHWPLTGVSSWPCIGPYKHWHYVDSQDPSSLFLALQTLSVRQTTLHCIIFFLENYRNSSIISISVIHLTLFHYVAIRFYPNVTTLRSYPNVTIRYVRVFAIANPSVCLSICRL